MLLFQITLAARYLNGRKLRSFLTTLSIVFGTLLIFGMNLLLPTMLKAFEANMLAASGQVDVTITHSTGEAFFPRLLNTLRRADEVQNVAALLSRTANIPAGFYGKAQVGALTYTGIEPRNAQVLHSYKVVQGRFLRADDSNAAVITTNLAETLGLSVGDKMRLPATEGVMTPKVIGLLSARTLPGNEEVLMTLTQAQKYVDLPDRINTVEINFTDDARADRVASENAIKALLGSDYTLGGLSGGSEVLASMEMGRIGLSMFGAMALFMGGFIIFNTFRTIVAERKHDIGMLRAIGARRATIVSLILVEGLLQGVVGSVIGIVLGYLMAAGMMSLLSSVLESFLHVQVSGLVLEPMLLVGTLALGVGTTLLAGLLPAMSANRITPLEALRPAANPNAQRASRRSGFIGGALIVVAALGLLSGNTGFLMLGSMLFFAGLILIAPLLVKPIVVLFSALIARLYARDGVGDLAQGNLVRHPSRSAVTASAIMIGLAVIVSMGGMVWSLTGGFLGILQRSLGSDFLIMPPAVGLWKGNIGSGQALENKLRNVPGVETVSAMRYAATTISGQAVSLLGIDPVAFPKVASLTFMYGDADTAFEALKAGRGIIANGIFASQAKLKVGDEVELSTPTGLQTYRVAGVASDYLNAKISTAYIAHADMLADFRKSEDVFIQINVLPGTDRAAAEARLKQALAAYPQFTLTSGQAYLDENRQLFDAMFSFYYVLMGVLTMPSLIALLNTLAISVIERTREIGMLRAIGSTRRQVHRMVVTESLLLAGMGTALGLLAGLYMGYALVITVGMAGFPLEYSFPYGGLIAATAIGLLFGVIAGVAPARQAARMNIVRALQYE